MRTQRASALRLHRGEQAAPSGNCAGVPCARPAPNGQPSAVRSRASEPHAVR